MNRCSYCGIENEDTAPSCIGCGTAFATDQGVPFRGVAELLRTPRGNVISTIAAILFICGGLFFVGGCIAEALHPPPASLPAVPPGTRTILFRRGPALWITLAAIVPVVALFRARFRPASRAYFLAFLSLIGVGLLAAGAWVTRYGALIWCPPAVLGLSVGVRASYAAAVLQIAGSAFLLYWLRTGSTT